MYQRSIESAHQKTATNMVNLPPKKQNSPSTAPSAISNSNNPNSNYKVNNNNGTTNSNSNNNYNIHNTNIIDSASVSNGNSYSNNNLVKTNQINNENRNQNVNANANVENYRPTYGAYITSILPRGPYLQYKFNDHQQQQQHQQQTSQHEPQKLQETMIKSHINENDNNEHLNHHPHQTQHPHPNRYNHQEQRQMQSYPANYHHEEHQLEAASACSSKDFRSLPYVVNANPLMNNNPLSNYHHAYQTQRPAGIAGAANNMAPGQQGSSHQVVMAQNMYNAQPCVTDMNTNIADSRSQWNSIYHPPPTRAMRSTSNPSLQSFNSAPEQGLAMTNASNINWHQINAIGNGGSQTIIGQDEMPPPKGYQTLPHKLKCGVAGGGYRDGGQHYRPIHHQHYHYPNEDSKSNRLQIKSRSGGASAAVAGVGTNNFLQQIKRQNSDMLARMSTTLAKNYGRTLSQQEIRYPLNGARMNSELSRSTNALNLPNHIQTTCINLDDVTRLRPDGLGEYEGWALLCQAVQALQDLFLTDTPSTLRILPLVRPSTIQITSRGRVVFIVTPTVGTTPGQLNKFNDMDTSPGQAVTAHLAPEFLSAIDKKVAFAESDIEKMWIYSLGMTLRNIIRGHHHQQHHRNNEPPLFYDNSSETAINSEIMSIARCAYQNHLHCTQAETNMNGVIANNNVCPTNNTTNGSNMNPYSTHSDYRCVLDISLDQVLGCMCERNLHQRASLMYLLDVISTFCRNQQQVKPFSHIVMELFAEVAAAPERDCDETVKGSINPTALLMDGSRSDTDSGRSSAHGDKDSDSNGQYDCQNPVLPIADLNYDPTIQQNLCVIRNRPVDNAEYQKYGTIGYAGVKALLMQKKEGCRAPALQVVRRHREGILKRKNSFRRNTIDINLFDLEKARQENFQVEEKNDLNKSKSTNCIDRIDDEVGNGLKNNKNDAGKRMEGVSMPDLNSHKMTTLPTTRPKNFRLKSFEALTKAYSEDSFWIKPNGPEFIIKSSLPSREIEIVDSKCQHRKVVSVLLLNGQSLHISCNALTTNARQIFEAVIKSENYVENFFIGLCALIGGDFVFLPNDLKIYKVAPQIWINVSKKSNNIDNVFFTLFLRIKFFLPTLRGISSLESRHMLYLQLRKSILEKHILCTDDDLITLGGLALQAEVGDFKESMKYSDYFTISHYLPEGVYQRNKEMAKYLRNSHYCRHGLHPKEAEQNFIKYIQDMKEYGFHLYSAVWTTDDSTAIDVYVGISLGGIALFERNRQPQANPSTNSKTSYQRKLHMSFEWLEIENLCFSKHILCLVVRKTESLKAKDNNRIKYKLKMDGRKSHFAFSLASEHHQFYMKLRNSFISLKSLSDKLNIPIASKTSTHTITNGMVDHFEGNELDCRENHNNIARNDKDVETDANMENHESDANRANNVAPNAPNSGGNGGLSSGIQENIKKIDKQLKASGLRVRNLKKSMLNDNRLMKLKQRFLRRSKSTVGTCSSTEKVQENDDNRKMSSKGIDRGGSGGSNNFPAMDNNERNNCGRSKEENQNKENECPKVQQLNDLEPKIYSPNRNRVKMGTRVFSTQFLNKSYDNIYDRTMNLYRFESANSINNDFIDNNLELFEFKSLRKCMDDGLSLRSTSLNSLYSSEKILNQCSESPATNDAYIIHSSIKSEKDTNNHFNNFTLPNETISESLMEKFNMSGNNTVTDRIISKVTVVKERLYKNQNYKNQQQNSQQYVKSNSNVNKKNGLIHNESERKTTPPHCDTSNRVGGNGRNYNKNSPKKRESIKYATLNQKIVKEYSECVNNRKAADMYSMKEASEYSKALWHLSRSQESIFINNKFPVRNGCLPVNQSNSNNLARNGNDFNNTKYNAEVSAGRDYCNGVEKGDLNEFTLGISIVQGADNNVYVKDLVKNGPAEKSGIRIGDQIIAVNGISLLNLSYTESLRLLQNTGLIVELQVSQIFNKNLNSSRRPSPGVLAAATTTCKPQRVSKNLVVSRTSTTSSSSPASSSSSSPSLPATTKLKFVNNERRNLNSILTNHCDEYLKRLEREHEEMDYRDKQEVEKGGFRFPGDTTNGKRKVARWNEERYVEGIGKDNDGMKRIGSLEITNDNLRGTRDIFESSGNTNENLCTLSPAKSMPDLPKVVAIIPKPDHVEEEHNTRKLQIVRSASQSRKYLGPIRYPVTPIKTVLSPVRHQLSLLADSDDEQVFI